MAKFTIRDIEGMRQLRIKLKNEAVRTTRGAFSHLDGTIKMTAPIPGIPTLIKSAVSKEGMVRPRFTGTGTIFLQPTMMGYHVFEADQQHWILEPGVFLASEGEVRLGVSLERMLPSMLSGSGMIKINSTISGDGKIAINAPGPVEEVDLDGEMLVKGGAVLGRTEGVQFSVRYPGTWLSSKIAGESRVKVYSGKGKVLINWTPYWNQFVHERMMGTLPQESAGLYD